MSSSEPKKDNRLQPLPESSGGGQGKPPRPTAVGTGGPGGDDDAEKARALYRQEIDGRTWIRGAVEKLPDWPLPALKFVELNGSGQSEETDVTSALQKLHSMHALVAHVTTSIGGKKLSALGVSCPAVDGQPTSPQQFEPAGLPLLDSLKWPGLAYGSAIAREDILNLLQFKGLHRDVGYILGAPTISQPGENARQQLATMMEGRPYAMVVLAAPIPAERLEQAEKDIRENPVDRSKVIDDFGGQLDRRLLGTIERSAGTGVWQTCVLYVAARDRFAKLEAALQQLYTSPKAKPPMFCRFGGDIGLHLDRLAMPMARMKTDSVTSLTTYKYLTPLTAAEMALFMVG